MAPKVTVGTIAYCTDQGLGYLAKDFFDHGVIQKVLIREHSSRDNHREWYPRESLVSSLEELIEACDTLLFFETPFLWEAIPKAREKGKKTVLMPMYECTPFPFHYEPDLVLCPSLLDFQWYKHKNAEFLPVPVEVPFYPRALAEVFVHNAGNGGLGGRNGTEELLKAMPYVKSPIKLIIRSQIPLGDSGDKRVDIRVGQFTREELWNEGDVFIFPEKFNGLSLPLQEAYASGMLVMAGDRYPMNTWLPKEPLIPVDHYTKERIAVEFDCAHYNPKTIAACIDKWYLQDITKYSRMGKGFARSHSWNRLKGMYREALLP